MGLIEEIRAAAESRNPAPRSGASRFVRSGREKRFRVPPCMHRGQVIERRERQCCGGLTRVDERFACSHPRNRAGDAWSVMCQTCALRRERRNP